MSSIHNNIVGINFFQGFFFQRFRNSILAVVTIVALAILGTISFCILSRKNLHNKKIKTLSNKKENISSLNVNVNDKSNIVVYKKTNAIKDDKAKVIKNEPAQIGVGISKHERFKASFSSLFDPIDQSQIQNRRNELADIVEIGRQIQTSNQKKRGAFGYCALTMVNWTSELGDQIPWLWDLKHLEISYDGQNLHEDIIKSQYADGHFSLDLPLEFDVKTGLLSYQDFEGKKCALLASSINLNEAHFIGLLFDPLQKKYVLCNNFHDFPIVLDIPSTNNPLTLNSILPPLNNPLMSSHFIIDMNYSHLIFDQKDGWKGLNWVLPKWRDNNCYLAIAWLMMAYGVKMSEIVFNNMNMGASS